MPFTFKLAHRLARAKVLSLGLLAIWACGPDGATDAPADSITGLIVVPESAMVDPGQTIQFRSFGRTAAGDSLPVDVAWSASAGSISDEGLYTADTSSTDATVTARIAQRQLAATARIRKRLVVQVIIAPPRVALAPGATQQFTVRGIRNSGDTVRLSPTFGATGGTIERDGLYTAGQEAGEYHVIATDRHTELADTAAVTVSTTAPPPPPPPPPPGGTASVEATVETDPSHHDGDTADDPTIWIHPTDPSLSLVIGDDKDGGLMVWGLDGRELQYVEGSLYNNLDLRYNFPLAGRFSDGAEHQAVALVGVGDEGEAQIDFFKVNPATRRLEPAGSITPGLVPYGACMYRSAASGKVYYFVNAKSGVVQQWDLSDGGNGQVVGTMVREFDVGTQPEGCVADDVLGHLYVGEEDVAIWKYGAEPGAGSARTQVDHTGQGGNLVADVEGLAIYHAGPDRGYLLASSQGNSTVVIYTREGANTLVGKFAVVENGTVDAVTGTDGLDVTNFALGPAFPQGLVAVHDDDNTGAPASNLKFVRWERIAAGLGLVVDTSYDVRSR